MEIRLCATLAGLTSESGAQKSTFGWNIDERIQCVLSRRILRSLHKRRKQQQHRRNMNSIQLTNALSSNLRTNRLFRAVYPADKLPQRFEYPASFIVNSDPSTRGGTHWIDIFIDDIGKRDYFNSY
ncbi:hypothetical protein J437_LFUL008098 [Ladona fulva]|uniref:Uncharacterized protein n=1 Tax=Ladona fulva TaxID=123851 RepID=A0A8K0K0E8_LADFU|nr:hypothetical protein J437_LFUL008098 [Ladona fulva]